MSLTFSNTKHDQFFLQINFINEYFTSKSWTEPSTWSLDVDEKTPQQRNMWVFLVFLSVSSSANSDTNKLYYVVRTVAYTHSLWWSIYHVRHLWRSIMRISGTFAKKFVWIYMLGKNRLPELMCQSCGRLYWIKYFNCIVRTLMNFYL